MTKDELFNHIASEFKKMGANVVVIAPNKTMRVGVNGNTIKVVIDHTDWDGSFDQDIAVIKTAEEASKLLDRLAIKSRGKLFI